MSNLIEQLEKQELIQKLMLKGYAPLIDALLGNEKEVYNLYSGNRIDKRKNLENALQQKKKIKKDKKNGRP